MEQYSPYIKTGNLLRQVFTYCYHFAFHESTSYPPPLFPQITSIFLYAYSPTKADSGSN